MIPDGSIRVGSKVIEEFVDVGLRLGGSFRLGGGDTTDGGKSCRVDGTAVVKGTADDLLNFIDALGVEAGGGVQRGRALMGGAVGGA